MELPIWKNFLATHWWYVLSDQWSGSPSNGPSLQIRTSRPFGSSNPLYHVKVEYQIQISISPLQIGCLELILNEHPHHWDKLSLQEYQNQLQQVQCKHRWLQQRLLKLCCNQHMQRRPGSTCTGTKITNQLLRMIQNKWMLPKTGLHPN